MRKEQRWKLAVQLYVTASLAVITAAAYFEMGWGAHFEWVLLIAAAVLFSYGVVWLPSRPVLRIRLKQKQLPARAAVLTRAGIGATKHGAGG